MLVTIRDKIYESIKAIIEEKFAQEIPKRDVDKMIKDNIINRLEKRKRLDNDGLLSKLESDDHKLTEEEMRKLKKHNEVKYCFRPISAFLDLLACKKWILHFEKLEEELETAEEQLKEIIKQSLDLASENHLLKSLMLISEITTSEDITEYTSCWTVLVCNLKNVRTFLPINKSLSWEVIIPNFLKKYYKNDNEIDAFKTDLENANKFIEESCKTIDKMLHEIEILKSIIKKLSKNQHHLKSLHQHYNYQALSRVIKESNFPHVSAVKYALEKSLKKSIPLYIFILFCLFFVFLLLLKSIFKSSTEENKEEFRISNLYEQNQEI